MLSVGPFLRGTVRDCAAGGLENNRNVQYSDIDLWLREPGYLDYLMPQFYWGLEYQHNGSTEMALADCLTAWLALPRDDSVSLYAGLGAYRIGEGDRNTASTSREWQSGTALAGQVSYLRQQGIGGSDCTGMPPSLITRNGILWPSGSSRP